MHRDGQEAIALENLGAEPGYTISPIGNGLIHETLMVSYGGRPRYVLQHVNTTIFPDPAVLAHNARVVTARIRSAVAARGGDDSREVLRFLPAKNGTFFTVTPDGSSWRLSHYVQRSTTIDVAGSTEEAAEIARAFAVFQNDLWDVPAERVHDAIPGFHNTPLRFRRLREVVSGIADEEGRAKLHRARDLVAAVNERADFLGIIERDRVAGHVTTHICHNDTKVNNVLLDEKTRRPLCIIDLDTIGRGSPLMDVGDLLRTAAATVSEEEQDPNRVAVDVTAATAIVQAFAEVLSGRFNARENQLLQASGWVITMEQAIRYLTDYLQGDIYYGERYPGQNFDRALNQLTLARSMERDFVDLVGLREA